MFRRAWARVHNSLAFRSAVAYRLVFSVLPAFKRSPIRVDQRFSYLTLSGPKQLDMLRASLWSLLHSGGDVPRLIIAGDRTMKKSDLAQLARWWPAPVEVWLADELEAFSDRNLPPHVAMLCRNHVYGLKAAAIMRASLMGPMVYADTDVLWFRPPQNLLPDSSAGDRVWLRLQQDRQMAYDSRLLGPWPFLEEEPYYCAGVMVASGDLRPAFEQITSPDVARIYETPGQFTEQTTFAALQRKIGIPALEADKAYISWEDRFTLRPRIFDKPWVLRHYVGPARHLYWRDLLYLYWRRALTKVSDT